MADQDPRSPRGKERAGSFLIFSSASLKSLLFLVSDNQAVGIFFHNKHKETKWHTHTKE
jgi:hypothetical protein